jgi:hypothetical protein
VRSGNTESSVEDLHIRRLVDKVRLVSEHDSYHTIRFLEPAREVWCILPLFNVCGYPDWRCSVFNRETNFEGDLPVMHLEIELL